MQKQSKGIYASFVNTVRTVNEGRSARRSASLCDSKIGCILAGTLLLLADGTCAPIEHVTSGTKLLTFDQVGSPVFTTVESQVKFEVSKTITLNLDSNSDGIADDHVRATLRHPFMLESGSWISADELKCGDVLKGSKPIHIVSSQSHHSPAIVYNIEVDGNHTYNIQLKDSCSVVTHNGLHQVYPYNKPLSPPGVDYPHKNLPDGSFAPDTSMPKNKTNQKHHFFMDAWTQANHPSIPLHGNRTIMPCIELTVTEHLNAHKAGREWLESRAWWGKNRYPRGDEWKQLTPKAMKLLSEHMAKSIGLPPEKIRLLRNYNRAALNRYNSKCK